MGETCHLGVLLRHALVGVDHNEADITAVDGHGGAEDAVLLDVVVHLGLFTHTCRIDEVILAVLVLKVAVDGVAGRACHVADDDALLAEDAVGEGGLAHIGLTDDGHLNDIVILVLFHLVGEVLKALVQQIASTVTVDGGHRHRIAETEVIELVEVGVNMTRGVHLVHRQHDGFTGALEHTCHLLIGGGHTRLNIGDKHDHIGVVDGDLRLLTHESEDLVIGAGLDTAGIHQAELAAQPLALAVNTVTGDTGGVLHDGKTLTDQLIKQHGFAHVGATHDCNQRFRHSSFTPFLTSDPVIRRRHRCKPALRHPAHG